MAKKQGTDNDDKKLNGTKDADSIFGFAGNDIILAGAGNDFVDGGDDNDSIKGENGDDSILGSAGSDTILGGAGNDTLEGGDDDDKLKGENNHDTLLGGAGNDTLEGGAGNDRLDGGTDEEESEDSMIGGAGNDTYIVDSAGDIVVETSATGGNDTIESYISYTLPTKNVENITLVGEDEINATGNEGVNKLVGNDSANQIDGKGGKDTIEAGDGDDTLIGGAGSDLLKGMEGNDSLSGDAGDDSLNGGEGDDTIDGGAGNDILVLSSTSENYQFEAGENDGETLVTYSDSEGEAGDGVDVISNVEFVQFSTGSKVKLADLLKGVVSNNPDNGNTGNTGNNGSENPQPTNHNPVANTDGFKDLTAGTAITKPISDLLANDTDSDKDSLVLTDVSNASGGTVSLDNSKTNFTFTPDANAQTASFKYGISDGHGGTATGTVNLTFKAPVTNNNNFPADNRVYDFELPLTDEADPFRGSILNEKILGLAGNDTLDGAEGNDYLDGGDGHDSLKGGIGDDYLLGGIGDDYLNGHSGNNSISGGDGNDSIESSRGDDYLSGGLGNDTIDADYGSDVIVDTGGDDRIHDYAYEKETINIDGGTGDDYIRAYGYAQTTIHGGAGNDEISFSNYSNTDVNIYGDDGDDEISSGYDHLIAYGGNGNDTINTYWIARGEAGKDTLIGGYNDTLIGGADADTITTGGYVDKVIYEKITDSGVGAGNRDIITDFDTTSGDVIDLSALSSKALTYLLTKSFDGTQGAVRINVDAVNKNTIVQVDMNGDKTPEMEIELTGIKVLAADDFVLATIV